MTLFNADPTALTLEQARERLAAEWDRRAPGSAAEIAAFHRTSAAAVEEIEAAHRAPERRARTALIVALAKQIGANSVLDVGCGLGDDLGALRTAGLRDLFGVEPHEEAWGALQRDGFAVAPDVRGTPVEGADLVLCIDVLPRVPDASAWLASWASRMRQGAVLVETCPSHDVWLPLTLPANHGFLPGPTLERLGFELLDEQDDLRVWQRVRLAGRERSALLLCAYRACSMRTMDAVLALATRGWRYKPKWGDALIDRSRAIVVSHWLRSTADDVFLMVDDDITFLPEAAEMVVAACRATKGVVGAAYPVRDGGHLALRGLHGDILFGPDAELVDVRHVATGFMAVHRDVVEALVKTMPLCHANQPWAFWPLFQPYPVEDLFAGGWNYLSEDWAFCERVRAAGFSVWLDPRVKLGHQSLVELTVQNMHAVNAAIGGGG